MTRRTNTTGLLAASLAVAVVAGGACGSGIGDGVAGGNATTAICEISSDGSAVKRGDMTGWAYLLLEVR